MLIAITNLPDIASAHAVARELVVRRLAACVNILPAVQSIYRWNGRIEETSEVTLIIKTSITRYDVLEQAIIELHPYDVPELIVLPVVRGLPAYLDWIAQESTNDVDD